MVAFVDGDPDRPLVTGVVPNARQTVPYDLPANKTKSTFRTQTHKGQGFNEFSFEDEAGREEMYFHAQKDMTFKVKNHKTERVDNNNVVSVGGASLREVQMSDVHNVGQNMSVNVGTGPAGDIIRGLMTTHASGVRGAGYFLEAMFSTMTGSGNYMVNAGAALMLNSVAGSFHTTGGSSIITTGSDLIQNVGGSVRVSSGQNFDEIVHGTKMVEAFEAIHLRCGKSEIQMTANGTIKIKGLRLLVEEDENINMKSAKIELN